MESILLPNASQLDNLNNVLEKRNFILGEKLSLSVNPGATTIALTVDVPTPYIYVCCNAGETTTFDVSLLYWKTKNTSYDGKTAYETVIRALGISYDTSQWIQAKGEQVTVQVKNNSDTVKNFDVFVFGVR